tara:strand:+ start:4551 stop:5072 length:522 start_codon:yes stop_codon:yes gene_type:complete
MKKIFLIIQFIFLLFFQIGSANINIVYIDMDNIMSTSIAGKSILQQLNDANNKAIQEFKKIEKSFKDQEKIIINQKNILSEVEFDQKVILLKSKVKEYTKNKKKKIDDLNQLKINNINVFVKKINKIILKYSKDMSISLILNKKNIIIGKSELDVSMDIIKIVNIEIKEFKIK